MSNLLDNDTAQALADLAADQRGLARRQAIALAGGVFGGIAAMPLLAPAARAQAGNPNAPGAAEISVAGARQEPIPIAIPSFGPGLGDQITSVINNDLSGCGLFRPLGAAASAGGSGVPDFATYKAMGARALVTGSAQGSGSNARVEFRLWDVNAGQQLQGTAFTTSGANWRRIAHMIADVIYSRMLGESGYFDTRICYVARSGSRSSPVTRLAIMDQDSANNRVLTGGEWLVLSPRFAPHADQIAFMSFANNRPRVYLYDLGSGRQRVLGEFPGMSFSPRFSPDGGSVVMAATRGGGSDIWRVGLGGGRTQLTNSGAIDVSPCYSPDGSQIVFCSDRGGSPQLYVMGAGGGGAKRISYGSGQYQSPVWSPRGDLIAFSRIGGSGFALGVMNPDGSGERTLTSGFTVEGASFCPNGRVIAYCEQSAAGSGGGGFSSWLSQIDIAGFNQRRMSTPGGASGPAWSPLAG